MNFLSREAGQARRAWLDDLIAENVSKPLNYFLGPTGVPQRLNALANAAAFTDAGDVLAAGEASRDLWNDPSIGNAANYAAAGAAMALPFYGARMGEGIADLADDARRFVKDEDGVLRLWHGSPHDFDKFSMDAIGTGEGAQAYGHGLYFAESEDIAKFYRDNYAKPAPEMFSSESGRQLAQDQLQAWAGDIEGGIADLEGSLSTEKLGRLLGGADEARITDLEEAIAYMRQGAPRGTLYEVDVNANPDDFLDWDNPLRDQPAWDSIKGDWNENLGDPDIIMERLGIDENAMTGQAYLNQISPNQGAAFRGVSDKMREQGVPGIKYLDAGSRSAGDGSRNYVVFDENLIEIVRKYGIAGAAMALGVSASDVQAAMAAQEPLTPRGDEQELRDYLEQY